MLVCTVPLPAAGAPAVLAIRQVSVVDVETGRVASNQTVIVDGDRIRAIGPVEELGVPEGAVIYEATGGYLVPGLMDMHVHLFNNWSRRPPSVWTFPLFVAHGVTGVREMWTEPFSMTTIQEWRERVAAGALLAPRVLAAGALVDGPGAWTPNMPEIDSVEEARRFVGEAARSGVDFIKVCSLLAPAVYEAIVAEAGEAGLPVVGHVPLRTPLLAAARAGQVTNEHLHQVREACTAIESGLLEERRSFYAAPYSKDEESSFLDGQLHRASEAFDEPLCAALASRLAAAGQWQVPTLLNERRWFLGPPEGLGEDPRLVYLPESLRVAWTERAKEGGVGYAGDPADLLRGWRLTLRIVGILHRSGVGLLAGTDFGAPFVFPGSSLHQEMALLVEAGLTPLDALRAASVNPARYLGVLDSLGTIEPGKLADLVVLGANPLEDIWHTTRIQAVVLGGRLLERPALDALLRAAAGAEESGETPR